MPFFDLGGGGLPLALVQGVWLALLFAGFGTLLLLILVAPPALARMDGAARAAVVARCRGLARWSLACAVLAGLTWLTLESAAMAGAASPAEAAGAIPTVVADTDFGRLLVAQIALAALALASGRIGRDSVATVLAGCATGLQAWHLHAAAMYPGPSLLLASEVAHVLAAGAWLGSLPALALLVSVAPPDAALLASRRFAPLGAACVAALTMTAFGQGWVLVGGMGGLLGTAYGWMVLVKIALFALLIGLAARNRVRLTPALSGADPAAARHDLRRGIAREAAVGLAIVLAAGVLASLPPGMHMTAGPFPPRPALAFAGAFAGGNPGCSDASGGWRDHADHV